MSRPAFASQVPHEDIVKLEVCLTNMQTTLQAFEDLPADATTEAIRTAANAVGSASRKALFACPVEDLDANDPAMDAIRKIYRMQLQIFETLQKHGDRDPIVYPMGECAALRALDIQPYFCKAGLYDEVA